MKPLSAQRLHKERCLKPQPFCDGNANQRTTALLTNKADIKTFAKINYYGFILARLHLQPPPCLPVMALLHE